MEIIARLAMRRDSMGKLLTTHKLFKTNIVFSSETPRVTEAFSVSNV